MEKRTFNLNLVFIYINIFELLLLLLLIIIIIIIFNIFVLCFLYMYTYDYFLNLIYYTCFYLDNYLILLLLNLFAYLNCSCFCTYIFCC